MARYADQYGNFEDGPGVAPVESLSAVSAVGPGTPLDGGVCRVNHGLVVTTSAGVNAGVVQLEGSFDGVNWFNMPGTASITTSAASTTSAISVSGIARFLRAAITTIISGGTVSAFVGSAG